MAIFEKIRRILIRTEKGVGEWRLAVSGAAGAGLRFLKSP